MILVVLMFWRNLVLTSVADVIVGTAMVDTTVSIRRSALLDDSVDASKYAALSLSSVLVETVNVEKTVTHRTHGVSQDNLDDQNDMDLPHFFLQLRNVRTADVNYSVFLDAVFHNVFVA